MASEPLPGLFSSSSLPFKIWSYTISSCFSCTSPTGIISALVKNISFQHRPSHILFSQSGMLLHHPFISFSQSLLIYQLTCHFFKDVFLTSPQSRSGSFVMYFYRSLFIFFRMPIQFELCIQCLFPSLDYKVYESKNHVYFNNHHCLAL